MAILTPTHADTIYPPITAAELSLLRPVAPASAAAAPVPPEAPIRTAKPPRAPAAATRDPRGSPGTRRRQRWENARLVGNPAFVAPSEADWAPVATHPRKRAHYYEHARLWAGIEADLAANAAATATATAAGDTVPRELRRRLKKVPYARLLLERLEREVIDFMRAEAADDDDTLEADDGFVLVGDGGVPNSDSDSDSDEIVFVGRARRTATAAAAAAEQREKVKVVEKVLLASAEEDRGAGFGYNPSFPSPFLQTKMGTRLTIFVL